MRNFVVCLFSVDIALAAMFLLFFLVGNPIGNDSPGLFNLNGEGNIPAWYSAMKLLAVAICAYFYGRLVMLDDRLAGWLILIGATVFVYLSMDEGATLHETIGDRFNMLVSGGSDLTAKPIFGRTGLWMVFLGPPLFIALVGGVIYLRKRLSIPTAAFAKAIAGITIFVVAAAPGDIAYNYVSGNIQTVQIAIEEFRDGRRDADPMGRHVAPCRQAGCRCGRHPGGGSRTVTGVRRSRAGATLSRAARRCRAIPEAVRAPHQPS